jgi:hypothetical protein
MTLVRGELRRHDVFWASVSLKQATSHFKTPFSF